VPSVAQPSVPHLRIAQQYRAAEGAPRLGARHETSCGRSPGWSGAYQGSTRPCGHRDGATAAAGPQAVSRAVSQAKRSPQVSPGKRLQ
jgi:hypothetical protein